MLLRANRHSCRSLAAFCSLLREWIRGINSLLADPWPANWPQVGRSLPELSIPLLSSELPGQSSFVSPAPRSHFVLAVSYAALSYQLCRLCSKQGLICFYSVASARFSLRDEQYQFRAQCMYLLFPEQGWRAGNREHTGYTYVSPLEIIAGL